MQKEKLAARICAAFGAYALAGGLLTLFGWAFNLRRLTDWNGSDVSQMPNNALAVAATGAALIFLYIGKPRVSIALAAFGGVLAAATLFEHLTGFNLGIDTLLLYRPWGQAGTVSPGRMGVPGSFSLTIAGASIVMSRFRQTQRLATFGALLIVSITLLSLIGYLFGADPLYMIPRLTTIAMQTSTMLLALGLGIVASAPDSARFRFLLGESAGALLVRRTLPAIIVLPILLGWLRLRAQEARLVDTAFGTAFLVFTLICLLTGLLWGAASSINKHEVAVRETRDRLAGILGSITDAFMTLDADWRFVFINEEGEKRIGKTRAELLGRNIWEVVPDPHRTARERLQRAMAERVSVEYEVLDVNHGRWFAGRAYPTPGGGLAVYSRDITERKESERAIEESEKKFSLLFQKAAFGAALARLPEGTLVDVNEGFTELFGFTREEALGRTSAELGVNRDSTMRSDLRDRLEHEGFLRDQEMTLYTKYGEARMFVNNMTIIELGGRKHLLTTVQDITEQKAADQALRSSAETLRTADRMKDEFLATLSHELRTPLTSIIGWSQLLLSGDLDKREQLIAIEAIRAAAKAQAELTDDVLDVSRITTGKMRLERSRTDLAPLIDAAVATVRPAAEARHIPLLVTLDRTLPPHYVDPDRVQQIVWNLVSNAIKFSTPGAPVEVILRAEDNAAVIEVTDRGQGISPDFLPYIFERFRQADSSSSRAHAGLGIGLALTKHLVEMHGGKIEVESEVGHGTHFLVRFPTPREPGAGDATDGDAKSAVESPLTGIRVLYVDDREDARVLITRMLKKHGAEVVQASSAAEALMMLDADCPHVVVTDIAMPEHDGYHLLATIRSDARWNHLPVLALTAQGLIDDEARAAKAGFQGFLRKPIESQDLAAAIARVRREMVRP